MGLAACARAAIVYVNGPSFQVPAMNATQGVALDSHGIPDFTFWSSGPVTTTDLPSSGMGWPFDISATGTNQFLVNDYALTQPFSSWIDSAPPHGCAWSAPGGTGLLTAHWQTKNGQTTTARWSGTLGTVGAGYLGVRFYKADGLHYGWIRARLPSPTPDPQGFPQLAPSVVDWAYETRANTPLQAGAIGSSSESMQFVLDFQSNLAKPSPIRQGSSGTFILTGDELRCEVSLAGSFSSVAIHDAPPDHGNRKPVFDMGQPLVAGPNLTVFFTEVLISHPQKAHLLHEAFYLTADGKLIGRIVPVSMTGK
jgi:hypothetical protein